MYTMDLPKRLLSKDSSDFLKSGYGKNTCIILIIF
jgi:hypothetical protein